jgi:tetratricopeptide (TPR) repeat protein
VPRERVLLLRADLPDGENVSVGSATLIGPRLALTAAHVVFDRASGAPLSGVVVGPPDVQGSTGKVLWPRTYTSGASPADLDVALVEITDTGWSPPALGPVRWGRLTGRSPGVPCEATGFPRVLRDPDGTRESDQISGTINPGTGMVTGRHDVTVTSAAPITDPADPHLSRWSGSSGAGVFCDGLLTAVLVIDADGFGHGRLTSVPAYRFLSEESVVTVLDEHSVSSQMESVELSPLLIGAAQESRVRGRRRDQTSPSMLLRADYEVVSFHGRDQLLTELTEWCTNPDVDIEVKLIVGAGGSGKTRLARKLVADMKDRAVPGRDAGKAWVTGFLAASSPPGSSLVARLADTGAPVLAVVDYGETRTAQLSDLLRQLWSADCAPVRLLVLARSAGDWWDQLARDLGYPLGAAMELPPLDETPAERALAFRTAVNDFAAHLPRLDTVEKGVNWVARAAVSNPPQDLDDARFGSPLNLQLSALLQLLNPPDFTEPAGAQSQARRAEQPEQYLLTQHEAKYWATTVPEWLHLQPQVLAEAVAAATLCGAADDEDALAALVALPSLRGQDQNGLIAVANWLRDLYPAPAGQFWGGLQPDRVGDHLVATTLTRAPSPLKPLLAAASRPQQYQALTVLARTMANRNIAEGLRRRLSSQLTEVFIAADPDSALVGVAIQVATETAEPARLIHAVATALDKLSPEQLRALAGQLPQSSLALADLAAQVTTALIKQLQLHATQERDHATPDIAMWLNSLALRLSDLGRREEALAAIEEAVQLYRGLAGARPDAFIPDLATSLNNLAKMLSDLGRPEEALAAIEEAVQLYRGLPGARPDAFTPNLALSLNNLASMLSDLGRPEEALAAIEEAVHLQRGLPGARPDAFIPDLATSLNNLAKMLSDLGRPEEALAAIEEAVQLYRDLAGARPDAFTPDLATSLNNLANRLSDLGRPEEALAAIEEAVHLHRGLAGARPDAFTPDLATSLNNFSKMLSDLGRPEEALVAIEEAVQLRRGLAGARPDAFTPDLATSLNNLSTMLSDLGRPEEALVAIQEAVQLRRGLAGARPDAFTPDLALSLNNLANRLSNLGRPEEALVAIQEAVQLRRSLAGARPDAFTPNLATSLNNLANRLSNLGRPEEALVAIQEAVQLRRSLAGARPDAFTPGLALSLNNLANRLSDLGRPEEALVAIQEAVQLYRGLAGAHPDAFTPDLAMSLNNLANRLGVLGRPEEALVAIQEAVQLRRSLAGARPDAFTPNLAMSLRLQGLILTDMGRDRDALTSDREATELLLNRGPLTDPHPWDTGAMKGPAWRTPWRQRWSRGRGHLCPIWARSRRQQRGSGG